jgi:hypothetical protein
MTLHLPDFFCTNLLYNGTSAVMCRSSSDKVWPYQEIEFIGYQKSLELNIKINNVNTYYVVEY